MTHTQSQPGAALLPVRPIRAGMLAFFAALACIEVGAGAVVGEAWKLQHDGGSLRLDDRWRLDSLLERLRIMEGVVAAGATACTILWSVVAVHNAARVSRHRRRTTGLAMVSWVVAPIALIASRAVGIGGEATTASVVLLMVQAAVLYVPFGLSAKVTDLVAGPRMPFVRWYLAVASALAVHHVFTSSLDLSIPRTSDNFGRTTTLYLVNAAIVCVMAVVANEASRGMQMATDERAWQQRQLQDDAYLRTRRAGVPLEAPAPMSMSIAPAQPSAPFRPPTVTPASPPLAPPPSSPPMAAAVPVVATAPANSAQVVQPVPVVIPEPPVSPVPDSIAPVSTAGLTPLGALRPPPPLAPESAEPAPVPALPTAAEPRPQPVVEPAAVERASNGLPSLSALIASGSATREP